MSKEFFVQVILDMGNIMFFGGIFVNFIYNVQNGYFQFCGEIVVVSLVQGGLSFCFFEECVYDIMVNSESDFINLNEMYIIFQEKKMFENIRNDLDNYNDIIVDYGYIGKID